MSDEPRTLADVERSITQKALYPRCATCRHYRQKDGECDVPSVKSGPRMSVSGMHTEGFLSVSPDFGCVLHEPKES